MQIITWLIKIQTTWGCYKTIIPPHQTVGGLLTLWISSSLFVRTNIIFCLCPWKPHVAVYPGLLRISSWNIIPRIILTLEIPRGQFDPLGFFKKFSETPRNLSEKINNLRGFNLWSFDCRINAMGQPYPKLWGKYKKLSQARSQGGAFWGRAPPLKWSAPPLNVPPWMFTIECPPRSIAPDECRPVSAPPLSAPSLNAPSPPTTPLEFLKLRHTTPLEFLKLRQLPPPPSNS